jgi:MFS family permease
MEERSVLAMETDRGSAREEAAPASVMHDKAFIALLCAATLSRLGDVCFMVALPWLVLKATGSAALLGLVLTAFAVPRALLMLVGGAFSDRYDSRAILVVVSLCQALAVFLIGTGSLGSRSGISYVVLWIVVFGLADAFVPSATKVFLTSLIERERLRDATAILQSAAQVCLIGGSAVAGLLVSRFGLREVFLFDALSYLPYAVTVFVLRTTRKSATGRAGLGKSIMEGLRHVLVERRLLVIVGAVAAVNFCIPAVTELGLVSISVSRYGSASVFGVLVTCVGLGSLAGLWCAKTVGKEFSVKVAMAGTIAGLSVCVAALIQKVPVWGLYVEGALLGALAGYINLHVSIWLQLNVRSDMLGRVMSVVAFSSAAAAPVSLMAGGFLAGSGVTWLFLSASVTLAVVAAVVGSSGRFGVQWAQ